MQIYQSFHYATTSAPVPIGVEQVHPPQVVFSFVGSSRGKMFPQLPAEPAVIAAPSATHAPVLVSQPPIPSPLTTTTTLEGLGYPTMTPSYAAATRPPSSAIQQLTQHTEEATGQNFFLAHLGSSLNRDSHWGWPSSIGTPFPPHVRAARVPFLSAENFEAPVLMPDPAFGPEGAMGCVPPMRYDTLEAHCGMPAPSQFLANVPLGMGFGPSQPGTPLKPAPTVAARPEHSATNLILYNIGPSMTENALRELFRPYGEVVSCAVMRDIHTGEGLGTAFVRYAQHDDACRAIEAFNDRTHAISVHESMPLVVQWARKQHDSAPAGEARKKIMKVFVRNVPTDCTREDLADLFGRYGSVRQVTLHKDTAPVEDDSMLRLIAFVIFTEEGAAERAARELHNTKPFVSCKGIPIMIKLAENTQRRRSWKATDSSTPGLSTATSTTQASAAKPTPRSQGVVTRPCATAAPCDGAVAQCPYPMPSYQASQSQPQQFQEGDHWNPKSVFYSVPTVEPPYLPSQANPPEVSMHACSVMQQQLLLSVDGGTSPTFIVPSSVPVAIVAPSVRDYDASLPLQQSQAQPYHGSMHTFAASPPASRDASYPQNSLTFDPNSASFSGNDGTSWRSNAASGREAPSFGDPAGEPFLMCGSQTDSMAIPLFANSPVSLSCSGCSEGRRHRSGVAEKSLWGSPPAVDPSATSCMATGDPPMAMSRSVPSVSRTLMRNSPANSETQNCGWDGGYPPTAASPAIVPFHESDQEALHEDASESWRRVVVVKTSQRMQQDRRLSMRVSSPTTPMRDSVGKELTASTASGMMVSRGDDACPPGGMATPRSSVSASDATVRGSGGSPNGPVTPSSGRTRYYNNPYGVENAKTFC